MKNINIMFIIGIIGIITLIMSTLSSAQVQDVNFIDNVIIEKGNAEGFVESTKVFNSAFYRILEVSHSPGLLFYFNVTDIKGNISTLTTNQRYFGGVNHEVFFEVYDHNNSEWILLKEYTNNPNFEFDSFDLSFLCDSCLVDDTLMFRYVHENSGITSHYFDVDYFILTSTGFIDEDVYFNIFDLDLDDTNTQVILLIILIISILMIIGVVKGFVLFGSITLFLLGAVLFLSGLDVLLSGLIMIVGVISIFNE